MAVMWAVLWVTDLVVIDSQPNGLWTYLMNHKDHFVCLLLSFIDGGVDPKSPIGTAAAFSKANKESLMLANTSILLEFTSQELMNSLNK